MKVANLKWLGNIHRQKSLLFVFWFAVLDSYKTAQWASQAQIRSIHPHFIITIIFVNVEHRVSHATLPTITLD
jgi:hypothetical protein